jgi:hypothetical protein
MTLLTRDSRHETIRFSVMGQKDGHARLNGTEISGLTCATVLVLMQVYLVPLLVVLCPPLVDVDRTATSILITDAECET